LLTRFLGKKIDSNDEFKIKYIVKPYFYLILRLKQIGSTWINLGWDLKLMGIILKKTNWKAILQVT